MKDAEERLKILCDALLLFVNKQSNVIKGEDIILKIEETDFMKNPTSMQDLLGKAEIMRKITIQRSVLSGKLEILEALYDIIDDKTREILEGNL